MSRRVIPRELRGALRELPLEKGARFGAVLELRETSPVGSTSPVAPRTVSRRIDWSFALELRRAALGVPGRGPLHVGDLGDGASVGTGVAMAVEAPAHAERRHLRDRFHLVDAAVAGDAADSCRHVRFVGEIGVVGKLVDANPAHRPAAGGAVPNRCELLAVPLHEPDGSSCRSAWAERSRPQKSRPRRDSIGNRDQARRRGACGCTGRAGRVGSPRPCTTGKKNTRCPRSQASDRDRRRRRPRSGACSTREGRSGPMARTPRRWRPVAQAASPHDGTVAPHLRAPKNLSRWKTDEIPSIAAANLIHERERGSRRSAVSRAGFDRADVRDQIAAIASDMLCRRACRRGCTPRGFAGRAAAVP